MAVRLRPRNSFEALDLGIALVRANLAPVYAAWFAVYIPAAVVVHLLLGDHSTWAWIILWWLKPAFDRAILAVLAPALFGEARPARAFFAAPSRAFLSTGLLPALTWRRLDLARSFHLPVHQLERLRGKAMRARLRVLDRDSRGAAVWLTFMLWMLDGILIVALSFAVALLVPVQTPIDTLIQSWGRGLFAPQDPGTLAGAILGIAATSLVEPFYVGCGFTLYLQRRTHLEGWDIELRFRQLTARVARAAAAGALCLAIAIGVAIPQGPARAAAPEPVDAKREIREVLKDPVFGHDEPTRRLRYVGPRGDQKPSKPLDWSWLKGFADFFASTVRVLSWTAGIIVVASLIYFLARYVRMHGLGARRGTRPDFLFGLDVRPGSLPEDVGGEAERLARAGSARASLSLLYRGALVRFIEEGVEFLQGDTEGDCVRRVQAFAGPARLAYFMKLVAAWQSLAYAHRDVETATLVELAAEWRKHFRGPSADPGAALPQPA